MQVCNAMMTTVKLRGGGARGGKEGRGDLKMVTGGRQLRVN